MGVNWHIWQNFVQSKQCSILASFCNNIPEKAKIEIKKKNFQAQGVVLIEKFFRLQPLPKLYQKKNWNPSS